MSAQTLARVVLGAAYALLLAELLLLPVPSEASSLQQSRAHAARGSMRRVLPFLPAATVVVLYLLPLLWAAWPAAGQLLLPIPLPPAAFRTAAGVVLIAGGFAITLWSTLLLRGAAERGRLRPPLRPLTTGPFRFARHPGVSGLATLYLGATFLFPAWLLLIGLAVYVGHMISRTAVEEQSLVACFGPRYHSYRRHVGRLAPLPAVLRQRRVPIAVLASGAGSNLRALWERGATASGSSALSRAQIACVISNNSGSGALAFARERGVPGYHVSSRTHRSTKALSERLLSIFARHRVELVLLAGYAKRLPVEVISTYRQRMLNLHPALLPRHGGRGMYGLAPHLAVLAAGDSHTGVTIHWVDDRYDKGAILMQRRIAVPIGITAEELQCLVAALEHDMYWRATNLVIDLIESGD